MAIEKVLIIDDEMLMRTFLAETLKRKKFDVHMAENGKAALSLLKENIYDMVITDMKMPDISGIDILTKVKEVSPLTLVVVITAFGTIENAVEAMRLGAFNYLIKPFSPDTIEAIIEKAKEHLSLIEENRYLRQQVSNGGSTKAHTIIAYSQVMKQILIDASRAAKSNANIFIHGESGTGKEVIAQFIHEESLRSNRPFIKVNCAAIPETLVESEFFGHEKGAFTGANSKRLGRFELAHLGTLLLDEITEIPLTVQAKLLRVIQEQEFERVGGTKSVNIDVRLISTSNRSMQGAIANKILREDLYFRLNVVPLYIPPLRQRKEDIIPLAEYFIEKFCYENHTERKRLAPEAAKKLLGYPFPGNARELGNIIERAIVLDPSDVITPDILYLDNHEELKAKHEETENINLPIGMSLQELEKRLIVETLAQYKQQEKTAQVLGISIRTLRNRLHEYNIR